MTEATYDYSEADVVWSDTDPTVPGPVGMPPEAGVQPAPHGAVIAGVPMAAVSVGMTLPRGPSLLVRSAVLVGVVLGTVLVCHWAFGQRGSLPIASASVPPVASPVTSPAPVVDVLPLPPPPALPLAAVGVEPPGELVVEPSRDNRSERRHHAKGSRHRSRRAEVGSWSSAGDWSTLEGARRVRPMRLRPIDVADPFVP